MMNRPSSPIHGIAIGLLILAVLALLAGGAFGYRSSESTTAVALFTISLLLLASTAHKRDVVPPATPPAPAEGARRSLPRAVSVLALAFAIVMTLLSIRGDIRTWLVVTLILLAAALLSYAPREPSP